MLGKYDPEAIITAARQLQIQRLLAVAGWMIFGLIGGCILAFSTFVFARLSEGQAITVILATIAVGGIIGGARTMWLHAAAHSLLCYVAIEANTRQIAIALQRIELGSPSPGSTVREPIA